MVREPRALGVCSLSVCPSIFMLVSCPSYVPVGQGPPGTVDFYSLCSCPAQCLHVIITGGGVLWVDCHCNDLLLSLEELDIEARLAQLCKQIEVCSDVCRPVLSHVVLLLFFLCSAFKRSWLGLLMRQRQLAWGCWGLFHN